MNSDSHKISRRSVFGRIAAAAIAATVCENSSAEAHETIKIAAKGGSIEIRPIKHATVLLTYKGKNYIIDPAQLPPDANLPKVDAIFVTHEHGDHCDPGAVSQLKKDGTILLANQRAGEILKAGIILKNGETVTVLDIKIEAVPAYNVVRAQFHPKGRDNGYILNVGGKRIYFAGDTENIPEMKNVKNIDIAFFPINLPYTMPPAEAAEAAKVVKPKLLIPYHQGTVNAQEVADALKGSGIDVKVMKLG